MGAVVSCIRSLCQTIGACIMTVINGIAGVIQAIISAIASFFGKSSLHTIQHQSSSPALPAGDPDAVEAESEQVMSSTLSVPASDSTPFNNHEKFALKRAVGTSSKGW
ncbi:hypothetical protein HYALB_00004956 [Hymenoscyphus albidus]|uniref:Uncharacterized protein n=1 Tax=Hymenoscyphus albidus TaxID=595503 RepID=A0A9N9PXU0_9HELO|nr:hypothetical protein HYALB_00004956 [Hymenoscyphus albidus]